LDSIGLPNPTYSFSKSKKSNVESNTENGILNGCILFDIIDSIDILVKNLAYHKYVGIRYSLDNWKSFQEIPASFVSTICPSLHSFEGIDRFQFQIHLNHYSSISFAVRYCVGGQEYWDNNYEKNYTVTFEKVECRVQAENTTLVDSDYHPCDIMIQKSIFDSYQTIYTRSLLPSPMISSSSESCDSSLNSFNYSVSNPYPFSISSLNSNAPSKNVVSPILNISSNTVSNSLSNISTNISSKVSTNMSSNVPTNISSNVSTNMSNNSAKEKNISNASKKHIVLSSPRKSLLTLPIESLNRIPVHVFSGEFLGSGSVLEGEGEEERYLRMHSSALIEAPISCL
jgi:hypothetical protein